MIYVMLIQDRHCDDEIELFTNHEEALEAAHQLWLDSGGETDPYGSEQYGEEAPADWTYLGIYSCEGDSIRVEAKELK